MAAGLKMAAADAGFGVIIVAAWNLIEEERRTLTMFRERITDGICLASAVLEPAEALDRAGGIPDATTSRTLPANRVLPVELVLRESSVPAEPWRLPGHAAATTWEIPSR